MKKLLIASSDEILLALMGAGALFVIATSLFRGFDTTTSWKPILIIFAICFVIFFIMLGS